MTYYRALFRCVGCQRKTPEGLLCLKCGRDQKTIDRVAKGDFGRKE